SIKSKPSSSVAIMKLSSSWPNGRMLLDNDSTETSRANLSAEASGGSGIVFPTCFPNDWLVSTSRDCDNASATLAEATAIDVLPATVCARCVWPAAEDGSPAAFLIETGP